MSNLLHEYDKYNYWEIQLTELPTRGIFYNKDANIRIRPLSVLEIKLLATFQEATATAICNELLQKCTILNNIELKDLYLPDRNYLVFWIRLNSFTSFNGFNITIPHCRYCGEKIEHELKLDKIDFDYLDNGYVNSVYLKDLGKTIETMIPDFTYSNIELNDDIALVAANINLNIPFASKYKFVANLTALDFAILSSHIEKYKCGIKTELNIECKHCNAFNTIRMQINDKNLFAKMDLIQILEMITQIAKYSNLQITNDWTWVEVEIEQTVINKMIKDEQAANQRQMSNLNAMNMH